ncbi:MAG: hypothetical protein R2709_10695 [Marmoricola sp.]
MSMLSTPSTGFWARAQALAKLALPFSDVGQHVGVLRVDHRLHREDILLLGGELAEGLAAIHVEELVGALLAEAQLAVSDGEYANDLAYRPPIDLGIGFK